ncbi:MAG TPA: DUF4349 domain-containing protein [Streptosporangiaceae bacterium]|nr:DUF4349 domain-containing protein [Streptosporangiaceae bacterium]
MTRSFRAFGARARHPALRALLIAGTASVGTGLILAACSAAGSHSATSGSGAGAPLNAPAPSAHKGAAPAMGTASGPSTGTHLVLSAQSIIYTATLSVRVSESESVTAAADRASGIVTAAGGYVSGQREIIPPGRHQIPQIDLTLKIPVAQYRATLAKLSALGTQISFSQHAQDVTQQVADVSSRVASAQAAIKQLRALLSKAGSVGQLLAVQEEINNQESDLEALLAQQRALAHETSYATVTAELVGHPRLVAHHKKTSPGFLAGLKGGWHALVVVVGWLLTALGSALPFLVPVLLIGAIAVAGRRRITRRKTPPAAEPPAPAAS